LERLSSLVNLRRRVTGAVSRALPSGAPSHASRIVFTIGGTILIIVAVLIFVDWTFIYRPASPSATEFLLAILFVLLVGIGAVHLYLGLFFRRGVPVTPPIPVPQISARRRRAEARLSVWLVIGTVCFGTGIFLLLSEPIFVGAPVFAVGSILLGYVAVTGRRVLSSP
jgi:hypothetical protein